VAGFGGNGITHSMLAGELLAAQLNGAPLPFAHLYHPVNTPGDA
jgi:glycine/D-amino acid oxidase-like deaminating enzyme